LIGTNLKWGGVRHHIHAIKTYSSHSIELAPSDRLLNKLRGYDFTGDLKKSLEDFAPSATRAVHSHVFPWFMAWCRRHQEAGIRWVHTYHLSYFPEHARGELEPWQRDINRALLEEARHADIRVSVARWQQEQLHREHGIETRYIPNGVDVTICDQANSRRFMRKTGLNGCVLYVGRNDPVKNPVDFVRLARRLPEQIFAMIGQELTDEVLLTEWDIEVPRNLHVLGAASHSDVQDAISACSALVVTSKREGLPTLVLEAMAHRKPIVVPNEAGCMEAVNGGEFGWVYRQGDIEDLADKTLAAIAEGSDRGDLARRHVLAEYDWRVIAPRLDDIYRGNG